MRITLRQLELFIAICQEQTVTAAAARVGLSQAATSQALAELENLLARKLFDRRGRRLQLNAAGRRLLPSAIEVLDRVRDIESSGARHAVSLTLYASLTVGNYMLPSIISRFARTRSDYRFQVSIGNTGQVAESLLRFESDAGWIEGIVENEALVAYPWREDPLVIVARPDHPLAGRKATITDLASAAWVLREKGSGTRSVFERAIEGKFRPERARIEFGGIEAVKRAVIAGAGLGCMSGSAVAAEIRSGQLRRIYVPWLDLRRRIVVLLHRDKYLDAGLRAFLRYCGVRAHTRRRTNDITAAGLRRGSYFMAIMRPLFLISVCSLVLHFSLPAQTRSPGSRPGLNPYVQSLLNEARARVREITPEKLTALRKEDSSLVLVDVREDREWDGSRIPGAIHIGRGVLEFGIEGRIPGKSATLVVYCRTGGRSALAADLLGKMGYTSVFSLAGGFTAWEAAGLAVDRSSLAK